MQIIVNTTLGKVEISQEVLKLEMAKGEEYKVKGVMEHLFGKEGGAGAIVVFKNSTLEEVKTYVADLPLFPFFSNIEYSVVEKYF